MQHYFAPLTDTLIALPALYIGLVFVLGLLIGSFLNVVIHRLPIMLDRDWRAQAKEILAQPPLGDALTAADQRGEPQVAVATSDTPTVDISNPPIALASGDVPTVDLGSASSA